MGEAGESIPPCPGCNKNHRNFRTETWLPFCSQHCAAIWACGVVSAGPGYYDWPAREWRDLA